MAFYEDNFFPGLDRHDPTAIRIGSDSKSHSDGTFPSNVKADPTRYSVSQLGLTDDFDS